MKVDSPVRLLLPLFALSGLLTAACHPALSGRPNPGPGTYVETADVRFNGVKRNYRVYVPAGYTGREPVPMVVAIHGAFDSAAKIEAMTGFSRLADRKGFVVLYPNGIGLFGWLRHWNAGHCCGKAAADDIDDVGFVANAIERICGMLNVDRTRIYMAGFSNGAMFTYHFAAQRSDLVAAIAALAGPCGGQAPGAETEQVVAEPERPVPLIAFHGTGDTHIPYGGGPSPRYGGDRTYWSAEASVRYWADAFGCSGPWQETVLRDGAVRRNARAGCPAGVAAVLYVLDGWGHDWPGAEQTARLPADDPLRGFDATPIIWEYFTQYQRISSAP